MSALTTTDPSWWLAFWVGLIALLIAIAWTAITIPLGILVGRIIATRRDQDAQTATDFGEPTRDQVEADVEADHEWAAILAAVGLTEDEIRAGYEAARLADRMDRIRDSIAIRRFADELREWDGGEAS